MRLLPFLLSLISCFFCLLSAKEKQKPNVILVLVDDMGWMDLLSGIDFYRTPNVDRLADRDYLHQWLVPVRYAPTRSSKPVDIHTDLGD